MLPWQRDCGLWTHTGRAAGRYRIYDPIRAITASARLSSSSPSNSRGRRADHVHPRHPRWLPCKVATMQGCVSALGSLASDRLSARTKCGWPSTSEVVSPGVILSLFVVMSLDVRAATGLSVMLVSSSRRLVLPRSARVTPPANVEIASIRFASRSAPWLALDCGIRAVCGKVATRILQIVRTESNTRLAQESGRGAGGKTPIVTANDVGAGAPGRRLVVYTTPRVTAERRPRGRVQNLAARSVTYVYRIHSDAALRACV
ncbi:hypothetical protein GY45DRAFT_141439 [Cubamyces sp. BRFM 1775]|nr:hypothetical protein GY45DRAFT_141439 [Cubamyces sp. BRFM 1775]